MSPVDLFSITSSAALRLQAEAERRTALAAPKNPVTILATFVPAVQIFVAAGVINTALRWITQGRVVLF